MIGMWVDELSGEGLLPSMWCPVQWDGGPDGTKSSRTGKPAHTTGSTLLSVYVLTAAVIPWTQTPASSARKPQLTSATLQGQGLHPWATLI